MKIALILPYFAKNLPNYFKLYLKSVEFNREIDFIFITNISLNGYKLPSNFHVKELSFDELNVLMKNRLEIQVPLKSAYKLCDYKPTYGQLFKDYLTSYDYWGFGDIDLIYGDLNAFVIDRLFTENYDILSFRKHWISGSMCFLKNTDKVNKLYLKSKDWQKVSTTNEYLGFDEVSSLKDKNVNNELLRGIELLDLNTEIESFTEVIFKLKDELHIRFETQIKESISKGMILKFDNGKVLIYNSGISNFTKDEEFANYHFFSEKNKLYFNYPNWDLIPNEFFISRYGFSKTLSGLSSVRVNSKMKMLFIRLPKKAINKLKYLTTYKNGIKRIIYITTGYRMAPSMK